MRRFSRRDLLKIMAAAPHSLRGAEPPLFQDVAVEAGLDFHHANCATGRRYMPEIMGSGVALLDFDNDGDLDIITNNRGDVPTLLRNDGGNANYWLTVQLIGTKSNRDGIGTSLKLTSAGIAQVEQAKGGMGYMSASDPRIHFGLGKRPTIESLEITWPSGQVDRLTNVPVDQIIAIKEGNGTVPRTFPKIVVAH
jgi:hypothetical protein